MQQRITAGKNVTVELTEKLKALCAAKDLTPADLARKIGGVPKSTMYNWFNGRNDPDIKSAKLIADALGVPLDYLADDSLDEPPALDLSPDERRIVDIIRERDLPFIEAVDALLAKARKLEQAKPVGPLYANIKFTGPDVDPDKGGKGKKA